MITGCVARQACSGAEQTCQLKLADHIARQDVGFNSIMIVGHNPGLTEFANFLVPGLTRNIPTCGVVSVLLDSDDWSIGEGKNAELVLYDYPKKQAD